MESGEEMTVLGRRKYFASFTHTYFSEMAHIRVFEYFKGHKWIICM